MDELGQTSFLAQAKPVSAPVDHAYEFFRSLERSLNATMPSPGEMAASVAEIVRTSKSGQSARHMAFSEGAFLNHYALPALYQFVANYEGMDPTKAREAVLSESYREALKLASGTPARVSKHPFDKVIGVSASGIVRRWKGPRALIRSCPDLALRAPFPYRTVFEGKYFRHGKLAAAETALATNIYQHCCPN